MYGKRQVQDYTKHDLTPAGRDAIEEILTAIVRKWVLDNPQAVSEGTAKADSEAIERRLQEIKEHQTAITLLQSEIVRIELGEHLPLYSKKD